MPATTSARRSTRSTPSCRRSPQLERLDARGVHELCPLLKDDAPPRHRRPQRHPPRSACAAAGQSAPAAKRTAATLVHRRSASRRSSATAAPGRVTTRERRDASPRRSWSMPRAPGPTRSPSWPASSRSASSRSAARSSPSTRRPAPTLDGLPFAKTVGDELYFAPESGRLFASPMDEVPSEPVRRPARRI